MAFLFLFFFSSRRRHTRWPRDWSSDVCSSDLNGSKNSAGETCYSPGQSNCLENVSLRVYFLLTLMTAIKFGTDGWRGVIAEDFTFANARIVAHAIARYVVRGEDARKGVLVGYDHRYASDRIAAAVAEVISASGTPVWLADKPCPTPAISYLVRHR